MEFLQTRLDNGLTIIAESNPQAHTQALGFFVRTGARDEEDAEAGVSHFLEHMIFKGSQRRSAAEVNLEFDEMGADYNAYTSEEATVYHANILPEFQARTVALLGDLLRPALREEDFDSEKNVILEEIAMYDDQPPFGADDKCRALFFGGHPLARSVLGTTASVSGISVEQMRDYCRRRYQPANITLAVAGKVDFDQLVNTANQICGDWQPGPAERGFSTPLYQNNVNCLHKESATQEYLLAMAAAPHGKDPRRFAAKLLSMIVGDDSGSRIYWELIETGKAEHASLHYYGYEDAGTFFTYLCCQPEATADNLQVIRQIYQQARRDGVSQTELSLAQSKLAARVVLGSERPRGRLFAIGNNWLYRREYRSVRDDLASIRGVTVADCNAILRDYPLVSGTVCAVGPLASFATEWNS
ncbi:MAG: pitrilysin family protein [Pirellulales bacterium]|nr:pitrilysin family protein [Pirellulales bacterium]